MNAAIIVFREGLEAVLILAAITASFVGARRRLRRPLIGGAARRPGRDVVTWVLAQTLLRSLASTARSSRRWSAWWRSACCC